MKTSALLACCAILVALALLAGCSPDTSSETASCMECHSGDTTSGNAVLAAQSQYDVSGHLNGPRLLSSENLTGYTFEFEGGNAMYCNGSSCSKCHTHQGFVDFVAAGLPATWDQAYSAASQPGCFTCHKPHVSGDFSLRKTSSETLIGTGVFNGGKGNLCVTCHKSLTNVGSSSSTNTADFFNTSNTFPKTWASYNGTHHGPQADFMMGANHYAYAAKTYVTTNDHLTSNADACVSCHVYQPTARLSGAAQLGGHGMYLMGGVHGSNADVIGVCRACHAYSGTSLTSTTSGSLTAGFESAISPDTAINTILDNIRANRDLLIAYFGNGTTNFSGAGTGPIESPSGGDVASGEWGRDWVFASSASLTATQSYAFWNFKYFIEDKSQGLHNPIFANEILWDSAEGLGLTPVGSRP